MIMKNRNYKTVVLALAAVMLNIISSPAWAALAGKLVVWGYGESGQTNVPPGDDFVAVSARETHVLVLRSDGSLVAWGSNYGDAALGSADIFYGQATVPLGLG